MPQEHVGAGNDALDHSEDAARKATESEDQSMMDEAGARVPYKSFRKKYQKMSMKFQEVMKQSDILHSREIASQRLFNHILREKNRLVDILSELNKSSRLDSSLHIDFTDIPSVEIDGGSVADKLSEDGKHYLSLIENAFEYSSDEESAPRQKNPMGLLEWLKQNQPQVFTESIEKSVKEEKPVAVKKRKTEGGSKEQKKDSNSKRLKTDEVTGANQASSETGPQDSQVDLQNHLPSLAPNGSNAAAIPSISAPTVQLPVTPAGSQTANHVSTEAPSMYSGAPTPSHSSSASAPLANSSTMNNAASLAPASAAPVSLSPAGLHSTSISGGAPGSAQLSISTPSPANFPAVPAPQIYSGPSIGNPVLPPNPSTLPGVPHLPSPHLHTLPPLPSALPQGAVHAVPPSQTYPVPLRRHDSGQEIPGNMTAHNPVVHQQSLHTQSSHQSPHAPVLQPPHSQPSHQQPPPDPFSRPL